MSCKRLASLGAVVLYLCCELLGGSPFSFLEGGRRRPMKPAANVVPAQAEDDSSKDMEELFTRGRLSP